MATGSSKTVDLGKKHECPSCGAKYYDLGRPKAICPKCGVDPDAPEEEEEAESSSSQQDAEGDG